MQKPGIGLSLLLQTDLSNSFGDEYAKSGVAVQSGVAELDFCDLRLKVPRHESFLQQLHTMHLCFDVASAMRSAPSPPEITTRYLEAFSVWFRGRVTALVGFHASAFWREGRRFQLRV